MPKIQYNTRVELSGTEEEIKKFLDDVIEKAIEERYNKTKKLELFYESGITVLDFGRIIPPRIRRNGKSNKENNEGSGKSSKELQQM